MIMLYTRTLNVDQWTETVVWQRDIQRDMLCLCVTK